MPSPRVVPLAAVVALVCADTALACPPPSPYVPWQGLLWAAVIATPPALLALRFRGRPGGPIDLALAGIATAPVGLLVSSAASATLKVLYWRGVVLPWGLTFGQELSAGAVTTALLAALLWARRRSSARAAAEDQAFAARNTRLGAT